MEMDGILKTIFHKKNNNNNKGLTLVHAITLPVSGCLPQLNFDNH